MEHISTLKELRDNLTTLENYLSSSDPEVREYALSRIKKGTCFVAYHSSGITKFAPSRFIGYKNNTITQHENNDSKDGRKTNPAISDCLSVKKPILNEELEEEYKKYCVFLGFTPNARGAYGAKRKYWSMV